MNAAPQQALAGDPAEASASTPSVRRLESLRRLAREQGLSAVLVTDHADIEWLTGVASSNAVVVVGDGALVFVTDFRYTEAARSAGALQVEQVTQELFSDLGRNLRDWARGDVVSYDPASLSHRAFLDLTEGMQSGVSLRATGNLVRQLREVKDAAERAALTRSAALLEGAYAAVAEAGLVGRTEREVAWQIERYLRENGAEGLSFDTIVAAGPNSALPHHHPGNRTIESGELVILDFGCVVDGYCSDCTRTFATGDVDDELRAIYDITLEAQLAALAAVQPGADGRAVDAVARDLISERGYGEYFGHGLGHGVGLAIHEGPRLARTSRSVLAEHHAVTVEPGIYLPGRGGVRIEDLVLVTADGCEILTGYTKEFTVVK